ncbi:MAG: hypothetical protein ACE5KM_22765, partial [Planctomycetaceae bacterium]
VDLLPMRLVHDPNNNGNVREHFPTIAQRNAGMTSNYIVDPLGWHSAPAASQTRFGNGGTASLARFNGGFSQTQAEQLVISPDVWPKPDGFEDSYTVNTPTTTSVNLIGIGAADLAQVDVSVAGRSRIVLFDATGRFSLVRPIPAGGIAGTTVSWTTPLPPAWDPASAGRTFTVTTARIETRADHFTWLLAVRNDGRAAGARNTLSADVDVVVFFKRQYTQEAERVFTLTQVGPLNRRNYRVTIPAAGPRPTLKKGLYICDVVNGRWHRIQRIEDENTNSPRIWLETSPPAAEVVRQAILMPGVVEVYPLGTK